MYSFRDQVLDPYNSKLRHSHSVSDHFTLPPTPTHRLCLNESTAELSTTLAGAEADLLDSGTLGDGLLTLGKDELDVAGVGHVGVDTTVSTVGAAAALGSLVDLDVLDNEVAGVETLGVGVGLSVLQEVEKELGGLDGPTSLADTPLLALSAATGAASVPTHGDSLSLFGDVVEEGKGALQLHAVDGLSGLTGVLEADTQVRAPGAGALSGRNLLSSVTDHLDVVAERVVLDVG